MQWLNRNMDYSKSTKQTTGHMKIQRPVFQQDEVNDVSKYHKPEQKFGGDIRNKLERCKLKSCMYSVLPALKWLQVYEWRDNVVFDLISGLTVAVMHIPQGLSYGLLGNVDPITGIYMAFFPVLIYFIFGTSRHVSIGTFAVVCLMTGEVVTELTTLDTHLNDTNTNSSSVANITGNATNATTVVPQYSHIQIATAVTLMVGIYQVIMYIFRLGIISTFLSESLVNGFTTAAAVHVLITQLLEIFGFSVKKKIGAYKNIYIVIEIFKNLHTINYCAVVISAVCIPVLVLNNEILKKLLHKYTRIPVPIELILVIVGTLVSHYCSLHYHYNLRLVGQIPRGLPEFAVPPASLLKDVAISSVSITIVSYTITLSMAIILATSGGYEINSNQELLAMGASNIFGSFFSCLPISASLSRSVIQQNVGGKTQVASLFSCAILFAVLLWIGPYFEPLPRAVLACIIIVALKSLFTQAAALKRYWMLGKLDAVVWLVTFFTVVLVDIEIGLLAGFLVSLLVILIKGLRPYTCLLGVVPDTDLYLDIARHDKAEEVPDVKIYRFAGGLSFAQKENFRTDLYRKLGINPNRVIRYRAKELKRRQIQNTAEEERYEIENGGIEYMDQNSLVPFKCLIIDLGSVSYIDAAGVKQLRDMTNDFERIQVPVLLASPTAPVFEMLLKCNAYEKKSGSYIIFPTIHDAVLYANTNFVNKKS